MDNICWIIQKQNCGDITILACNCRKKNDSLLEGKPFTKNVVYQATVKTGCGPDIVHFGAMEKPQEKKDLTIVNLFSKIAAVPIALCCLNT